jgi:hypothetical protein
VNKPLRAKLAALVILFVLGTFAGQIRRVLDSVRGTVDRGARITGEIRSTVSTIGQAVDDSVASTRAALETQVADLQAKLASGTATPAQVTQLQGLVERLRVTAGRPGPPGPAGPSGAPGPPPPTTSSSTTTATGPGGTPSTTRPSPTTTTTKPPPTTTTTRCTVGVGKLLKVGCS